MFEPMSARDVRIAVNDCHMNYYAQGTFAMWKARYMNGMYHKPTATLFFVESVIGPNGKTRVYKVVKAELTPKGSIGTVSIHNTLAQARKFMGYECTWFLEKESSKGLE